MTAPRRLDNRYDLVRPVGQGGMGVVWEAKDALLNRRVAIKEIKLPASVPDEEQEAARARLLREARAAARLQHPSAVTVYTVVTDGAPYIVMEFVDAPSLTELVRREGTLSPERPWPGWRAGPRARGTPPRVRRPRPPGPPGPPAPGVGEGAAGPGPGRPAAGPTAAAPPPPRPRVTLPPPPFRPTAVAEPLVT